ncbi:hypothetical protein FPT15_27510 [Pseudomonas sp. RGB]|nr:hypothetical protein FPT15_27510 [Pseudomonas sp. RGB]
MIACILESRGVRGKGESVEGLFMKCVGASTVQTLRTPVGAGLPAMQTPRYACHTAAMPSQASQLPH